MWCPSASVGLGGSPETRAATRARHPTLPACRESPPPPTPSPPTNPDLTHIDAGRATFRVFRRVNGWDRSPLGTLYRPQYFNGGIAVHGYTSVPSTPASHGCVRVSLPAMDNLWGVGGIQVGTSVLVY